MIEQGRAGGFRLHAVVSIALVAMAAVISLAGAESAAAKPLCQGQKATIKGTPDGETIKGTDNADVIRARAGNDTILGLGGNDVVCSGKGADNADGAEGNDSVNGGEGNDNANGGGGDDRLVMHSGTDKVNGGAGVDECRSDEHSECEADLRTNVTGPSSVTTGDDSDTYRFNVEVGNNGPTDSVNTRVDVDLPGEPAPPARIAIAIGRVEYVPEESDARCNELDEDTVRCVFGGIATGNEVDATIALRFLDCSGQVKTRAAAARRGVAAPQEGMTARATDAGTADPVGNNDADTHTFQFQPDPICFV